MTQINFDTDMVVSLIFFFFLLFKYQIQKGILGVKRRKGMSFISLDYLRFAE